MSKLLIVSLLALSIAALSGCGDGGTQPEPAAPADQATAADESAAGTVVESEDEGNGDPEEGEELFATACAACHGPEGEGIEGLGKNMATSEFIAGQSDEDLLAFVEQGRPMDDPLNTTGIEMPAKGGNAALTDEQLLDIIAFIRTLQE